MSDWREPNSGVSVALCKTICGGRPTTYALLRVGHEVGVELEQLGLGEDDDRRATERKVADLVHAVPQIIKPIKPAHQAQ